MARRAKKTPGINGSSSADIAFMLLIFFLITTSMDTDKGLLRRLPPLAPKQQNDKPVEVNERNVMRLLVNRNDEIVISKSLNEIELVKIENLKDRAVEFILNPNDDPNLPEKKMRECGILGNQMVVTAGYAISLKSEIESSYQMFVNVQNELLRAYKEVWETYAQKKFKRSFESLNKAQKKAVTEAYPIHISEMPLSNLDKK